MFHIIIRFKYKSIQKRITCSSSSNSVLILGDLWQLPPIYDSIITDNNCLDGRPDFAPSHWKDNFKIYYLTQKMRSKEDSEFSSICDRVGRANINKEDEDFLRSRKLKTEIEDDNENFKTGKIVRLGQCQS